MAKKVLLDSNKTNKQAAAVLKAQKTLKDEKAKLRSSQEEETDKAFIELGEKIVKHYHIKSVSELDSWYRKIIQQVPYKSHRNHSRLILIIQISQTSFFGERLYFLNHYYSNL